MVDAPGMTPAALLRIQEAPPRRGWDGVSRGRRSVFLAGALPQALPLLSADCLGV